MNSMQAEEIGLLLKQERGQFLEFFSAYEYRRGAGQKNPKRTSPVRSRGFSPAWPTRMEERC